MNDDFTDDDYARLAALLGTDWNVVDLIIHLTGGISMEEAAQRLIERGSSETAQGRALIDLAELRAAEPLA